MVAAALDASIVVVDEIPFSCECLIGTEFTYIRDTVPRQDIKPPSSKPSCIAITERVSTCVNFISFSSWLCFTGEVVDFFAEEDLIAT